MLVFKQGFEVNSCNCLSANSFLSGWVTGHHFAPRAVSSEEKGASFSFKQWQIISGGGRKRRRPFGCRFAIPFLFFFPPGNCNDYFVKPAGSFAVISWDAFLFLSISPWVTAEMLQRNNSFCVRVLSASTVHSSPFFLPVIHLHAVIKQPNLCPGGTAVASSCRRLRPRCASGSGLLGRADRASLQLAATAGGAVLPGLHLPFGSLGGTGWL